MEIIFHSDLISRTGRSKQSKIATNGLCDSSLPTDSSMANVFEFCKKENIKYAVDGQEVLFKASDVGRYLSIKNIRTSTVKWTSVDKKTMSIDSKGGPQKTSMLTMNGVRRFVCSSRTLCAGAIAREFGIDIHSNKYLSKETDTLTCLRKIFVGVEMVPQFICGKYRIDMYLPLYKLAIECDEEGHDRPSRVLDDLVREEWLKRELGCTFIRYKPDDGNFDLANLAGRCFERIMEVT